MHLSNRPDSPLIHPFADLSAHRNGEATTIVRAEGVHVFDEDGNRYLDAMSGSSCASLGFSSPDLISAFETQLKTLPYYHLFAQKSHGPARSLAERLVSLAPDRLAHAFLAASGSEANDTAIKLVWAFNGARGKPEKRKIIVRHSGYHGSTIMTAAASGQPHMHLGFNLPMDDFVHIPEVCCYRNANQGETEEQYASRSAAELEEAILRCGAENVAAFMVEPVMASAGCLLPPEGYFGHVGRILDRYDIALIVDEIVCGLGRLGVPFGSYRYGLRPDVLTLAKPLTGGYFPLSAVLTTNEIFEAMAHQSDRAGLFGHGFTYGGHPLGCAVANAALDVYEKPEFKADLAERIRIFERHLSDLSDRPLVGEVRNCGLLGAMEIVRDKDQKTRFPVEVGITERIGQALQRRGVITRWTAKTVNLCPPLIISESELGDLFQALGKALDDVSSHFGAAA